MGEEVGGLLRAVESGADHEGVIKEEVCPIVGSDSPAAAAAAA